jgi:hypothetical protein
MIATVIYLVGWVQPTNPPCKQSRWCHLHPDIHANTVPVWRETMRWVAPTLLNSAIGLLDPTAQEFSRLSNHRADMLELTVVQPAPFVCQAQIQAQSTKRGIGLFQR